MNQCLKNCLHLPLVLSVLGDLFNFLFSEQALTFLGQLLIFTAKMNRFGWTLFGLLSALPLVLADDDDDEPGLKGSPMERTNAHIAHGVVAGLAFVIFLPIGAILLRGINSPKAVFIHRVWQIVSLGIMLLGFALGLWLSYLHNEVCVLCSRRIQYTKVNLVGARFTMNSTNGWAPSSSSASVFNLSSVSCTTSNLLKCRREAGQAKPTSGLAVHSSFWVSSMAAWDFN